MQMISSYLSVSSIRAPFQWWVYAKKWRSMI